jgi:hypothetical protein
VTVVVQSRLARRRGDSFGQSEVENFGVAAIGDEEISRLYIAMDNSPLLPWSISRERLSGRPSSDAGLNSSLCSIFSIEVADALDAAHNKETALVLANLVDGADIGMIQRGGGMGLAAEVFKCLLIPGNVIR